MKKAAMIRRDMRRMCRNDRRLAALGALGVASLLALPFAARAADPPDPALLREADAIDAVAGKLSRAEAALVDQPVQEALAAQHARQIEACAARLGLDPSAGADALVARQPTDAARAALRRLVTEHARLSGTLRAAAERDEAARVDSVHGDA